MTGMPRLKFPEYSLLAAMLSEGAMPDIRRAARRLRAEAAPVVAVDDEIAGLARGLVTSEVSRSAAVLDALPPLFWLEAGQEDDAGSRRIDGWIVDRKPGSLAARAFSIAPQPGASPEPGGVATVFFGAKAASADEDGATRTIRGLVTAVSLQEMLLQMGEASPVVLSPAEAAAADAVLLRGLRLSVATSPELAGG